MNITSSSSHQLPALRSDGNLQIYLQEIRRFPLLPADEEFMLAKAWRAHGDLDAAHKLVTSHLRLVAKIALGYRGYGLPVSDLIAEGNIGMMQAVKRYDPDKGYRLATYAMWWIRAAITEYILHSWSLVKMGTTASQKKLFFNLSRMKRDLHALDDGDLTPEQVKKIAHDLVVSEQDVISMNRRLIGGDQSLNAPRRAGDEEDGQWQDWLADEGPNQEKRLGEAQEAAMRQKLLTKAIAGLGDREREIIVARRLAEPPQTLEDLSQKYGVSRERVRQIEARAFQKLQANIKKEAVVTGLLPPPEEVVSEAEQIVG